MLLSSYMLYTLFCEGSKRGYSEPLCYYDVVEEFFCLITVITKVSVGNSIPDGGDGVHMLTQVNMPVKARGVSTGKLRLLVLVLPVSVTSVSVRGLVLVFGHISGHFYFPS